MYKGPHWQKADFVPKSKARDGDTDTNVGKTMPVMMPIKIGDMQNDYILTLETGVAN